MSVTIPTATNHQVQCKTMTIN